MGLVPMWLGLPFTVMEQCRNRTVTVTEALVLCLLLEDRGHITESIRILVPVDRIKQNIAAVSARSVACSMLAVQQQKKLCRQENSNLTYFLHVLRQNKC